MLNTNEDKELLLNQWQTCVDMSNSVSQRRDNMNNIFITLNLAIIAAVFNYMGHKIIIYPDSWNNYMYSMDTHNSKL